MPIQLRALALITLSILFIAARSAAAEMPDPEPAVSVGGYLTARYTFRTCETSSRDTFRDEDIYSELRIDMTAPRSGRFEFHFLGSSRKDLDGNSDLHTFYPLEDIGNTSNKDTLTVLYEAHLDINQVLPGLTQIRLGRQASIRDIPAFFDGAALDISPFSFMYLSLYGGRAVNFFEVNGSEGTDRIEGAGIDVLPFSSTGISVDFLALSDERNYFDEKDTHDRLIAFKLSQRFTRNVRVLAKYRYQNGESRDVNVRFLATFPVSGTEFGASYMRQLKTQNEQSTAISPFYDVLGPSFPYQSIDLRFRTAIGSRYFLDLGYFRRELLDSANEGMYNREYSRSSAGLGIDDLFMRNLSGAINGEVWDSQGRQYKTAGADLTYAFGKKHARGRASIGTYYSLYKYESLFQYDEHDRVRTYYIRTKIPVITRTTMDLTYEWEDGVDTFQTIKAGLRYDF